MKRFAHNKTAKGYEDINVWQVKELKIKDVDAYKQLDLYSTHRHEKQKMTFVDRNPNMYFRYNESFSSGNGGSEESLTHELIVSANQLCL